MARQVLALGLALSLVAMSLAYPLRGYLQQQAAEAQALAEQQELAEQISALEAQVAALHDPAFIRAEAKRRLQYVSPGDTVYVVKVPASTLDADTSVPNGAAGAQGRSGDQATVGSAAAADADTATDDAVDAAENGVKGPDDGDSGTAEPNGAEPWYESLWDTLRGAE